MPTRGKLHDYLHTIRQKERLTAEEAEHLLAMLNEHPCDANIYLTVIDVAWRNRYHNVGFEDWQIYYAQACDKAESCWSPRQQARIDLLASALYFNDEQDELAAATAQLAYQNDPDNPGIIRYYLDLAIRFLSLPDNELDTVTDRLVVLTSPDDANEQHQLGCYFQRLWALTSMTRFRYHAAACYQRALELGLHKSLAAEARQGLAALNMPTE
ncbi:MAG: hypothetical protein D6737_05835 [Chloroflexi bacterium]|nr:MAG: hypothetical protein D6737_05835 [Chloroflexota bacterium]